MVGFGLILALAGIIFLIIGAAQAAQNHAYRNAQTVTGTVTNKRSHRTKNVHEYMLRLSYSVNDVAYEREVAVIKTEFDAIGVGGQYKVLYRPDKPKKILSPKATDPKTVKVILIIAAALLVVGVVMLFSVRLFHM